jgi:hypothetical protein
MSVEMIFNELSLESRARDIHQARQWMSQFIQTLRSAISLGIAKTLRTNEEFQIAKLCDDYTLAQWRNDVEVSREERQFFKTLVTKSPYLVELPNLQAQANGEEFYWNAQIALGLGYAYLLDALAVSFCSASEWNREFVSLAYHRLVESDSGSEIQSEDVAVQHCSAAAHLSTHKDWLENRCIQSVKNGSDLWNRRKELFQKLVFCDSVQSSLLSLYGDDPFKEICKWLFFLEGECKSWTRGPFRLEVSRNSVSPESQATLQQYGGDRMFRCPDGESRVFSFHIKLSFNNWRLYFYPVSDLRTIFIGYVGPHLRTVKYG